MSERDPDVPPDATVVRQRLRPGEGRRRPPTRPPDPPRTIRSSPPPPNRPQRHTVVQESGFGLNPLAQAAAPLLLLAGRLRTSASAPADVRALRADTLQAVRRFEARLRDDGRSYDESRAASYALCATLDEAVLATSWGESSGWGQQTLLVELHQQTFGGQKFFDLLDNLSQDPRANLDFIEFQYLCMAVGFSGKYYADSDRARAQLGDVQRRTYAHIVDERGAAETALADHWRGREDRRNPIIRYVPWWVVAIAVAAIVVVVWALLSAWLTSQTQPVKRALAAVGAPVRPPDPPTAPARTGITLKQLLSGAEQRQAVKIEEYADGRTWITPLGEPFASGRATLNPGHESTLQEIARALAQVPGSVVVTGHTDAQAIRRGEFSDNYDLSRARAATVVQLLESNAGTPLSVRANGVGSDEPLRQPADDPANYSANRRVEIVHTPQQAGR
jgi:type VI secretion system protein ImpK